MNNGRNDSKFSTQCVSIFNRDTLVLFFVNVEQTHYLDCLFIVILKNMKVPIILKNTKVWKIGMRVGIQNIGAPKSVGWDGLYESDPNVLYVYRIW